MLAPVRRWAVGPLHTRGRQKGPADNQRVEVPAMRTGSVLCVFAAVTLLASVLPEAALGQAAAPGTPRTGITAGLGNVYGGFGVGLEQYFLRSHISGVVGGGFVPGTSDGNPQTGALAAAVRGYAGGKRHRGFLEASVSLVAVSWTRVGGQIIHFDRHYGPGLSVGYQYTAVGGFSVLAGLGAGWALGAGRAEPIASFGLGHTWRR